MIEFDECLRLRRDIIRIEERIFEMSCRAMSPKNQIITDMPKGGGEAINSIEQYIIKTERLENQKRFALDLLVSKWREIERMCNNCNIKKDVIIMLQYRFFFGLTWEKCANQMNKDFPNRKWNENKCFREYRHVLYEFRKWQV